MNELSNSMAERSRKIERVILHAIADKGQAAIADGIGTSESTVSRLKDGQIETLSKVLAACGLKVVPSEYKCIDPQKAQAMVTLYEAAMSKIPNTVELLWGDE
jgi:predicted XRE-type DNA-binding protein